MFSKFSEEAQKVLIMAKEEMMNLHHPYVGTEHLMLSILKEAKNISDIFADFEVNYDNFYEALVKMVGVGNQNNTLFLYTPLLKRVLENASLTSRELGTSDVSVTHLILALLEEGDGVAIRVLDELEVDLDELYDVFSENAVEKKEVKKKKLMIEDFGVDLTKKASKGEIDPVIGREKEIERTIEILSRRSKNNPLLVGEAGVGKTAIVEELARRIITSQVPTFLKGKRIISVEIANLVAGTKYRGEFEERVSKILKEVEGRNDVIVFIDEVHTLVGAGGAEGAIDASNILKPALARGKLKLIGATTIEEYKKTIEKDKAFDRRFQKVEVLEPTDEATFAILKGLKELYASFHHVKVDDEVLKYIVRTTNDYIYERMQPDKAIDVLDEVCARVQLKKETGQEEILSLHRQLDILRKSKNDAIVHSLFKEASLLKEQEKELVSKLNLLELKSTNSSKLREVRKEDVSEIIFQKTKIPVYEKNQKMMKELSKLETDLLNQVCGQGEAVRKLCDFTKRLKFGLKKGKRPASFLFVGPTGVGKTYLVKEYAKFMGGCESLIRLDMSEYMESHSASKIIGSPSGYVGYEDGKNVLDQIRLHPHAVILLDEIEKANPRVMNLFLQALDEGFMTSSSGVKVRFDHTTIIMTSNIGFGRESIGFCHDERSVLSKLKEFLSIEFINRLDEVIVFRSLEKEDILKIVDKKLKEVKMHFKKQGITLTIQKKVASEIVELSKYSEFGARKIDKIIEEKIDKIVIDSLIQGENKVSIKTVLL